MVEKVQTTISYNLTWKKDIIPKEAPWKTSALNEQTRKGSRIQYRYVWNGATDIQNLRFISSQNEAAVSEKKQGNTIYKTEETKEGAETSFLNSFPFS